jgi:hypothetical protein
MALFSPSPLSVQHKNERPVLYTMFLCGIFLHDRSALLLTIGHSCDIRPGKVIYYMRYWRFGKYLCEKGLINETDVLNARLSQKKKNLKIGELALAGNTEREALARTVRNH